VLDVVNSLSDTLISDEAQIQASTDPKERANLATQIKAISSRIGSLEVIAASIEGGRVVQPASVPASPTGPGVVPISLIGLLLGLIVGAAVAVIRGLLSDQIRDQDELSAYLGAPVIGRIPAVPTWHSRGTEQLITAVAPWSPAAEAYRTLATNIRFRGAADRLHLLVVTSALMEEGKSATATNLAVVLAEIGIQTLLVDADLRRSRAGRFLGIESGPGLQEALEGWADVTDLIVSTSVPRLAFLRSGETPVDPVALLSAERADRVFERIASLADLVICDAPPVLPVADSSLLAKRADAVLFVNDPAISSRGALKDAVQQLRTVGTPILGGVYNNITPSRDRYGDRYDSPSLVPSAETTEAGRAPSAPARTLRERRTPMRHTPSAAVETGPDAPSPGPFDRPM
jgi:capsular exopolysaccharide synthesis family protein